MKNKKSILRYRSWDVFIQTGEYANGRIAIQLIDANDYCPVATATVNIPEHHLNDDEIIVKGYSENKGMESWLQSVGLVTEILGTVPTGFVEATVCRVDFEKLCEYDPGFK